LGNAWEKCVVENQIPDLNHSKLNRGAEDGYGTMEILNKELYAEP
jgi:hypothetical protein